MRSEARRKFANLISVACFSLLFVIGVYSQAAGESFYVKAEVRGTLNFREGRGYFVEVPSKDFPKERIEVWLNITGDKVLGRQLQQMTGKTVVVRGRLEQLPSNVTTSIPSKGIYICSFEIELA